MCSSLLNVIAQWPHMFTDPAARRRAQSAWKSYVNTLTDEWTSANVIVSFVEA